MLFLKRKPLQHRKELEIEIELKLIAMYGSKLKHLIVAYVGFEPTSFVY